MSNERRPPPARGRGRRQHRRAARGGLGARRIRPHSGADRRGGARQPIRDFVLLDLGLPDLDGAEVCRRIRSRSDVPIIVVTAREDELDRVLLLEMGADDYVVKPFGFRELVARIRAVRRRLARLGRRGGPRSLGTARSIARPAGSDSTATRWTSPPRSSTSSPTSPRRRRRPDPRGHHRQRVGRALVGPDQDARRARGVAAPQARRAST